MAPVIEVATSSKCCTTIAKVICPTQCSPQSVAAMKPRREQDRDSSQDSDDSEPDVDQTDRALRSSSRSRRDTEGLASCSCPLPSPTRLATRPKWLPPGYNTSRLEMSLGNPVYGYRMQMYCRTGYHLAIFPDKKVRGVDDNNHPCALVEFSSVDIGEIRIRGMETNLYLAMNEKGKLYGEVDGNSEATVFVEYVHGQYNAYLSRKWAHMGWYTAIKKSGKIKPGHQTRWGQKAIQFLLRRSKT